MNTQSKLVRGCLLGLLTISVASCASFNMKTTEQPKPGFANSIDIPLPQTAKIDMNKTTVMGGGNTWTGHLVYNTRKTQPQVIDFVTSQMQNAAWTKISELRSKETVINFVKGKRVATVRIMPENHYIYTDTSVSIDMVNSNLRVDNADAMITEGRIAA